MKTPLPSLLILAAALGASALAPLSAASKNTAAIAYAVKTVASAFSGYAKISSGATLDTVFRVLGSPRRAPSSNVWVYHHYHADLARANEQGCDTVVITFIQGSVASMLLANYSAADLIAANLKPRQSELLASRD
jgi:hypothetical protein